MYKTVIWATDGSDGSEVALRQALRLTAPGGRLVAVHCDQRMTGRAAASPVFADEDDVRISIRQRVKSLEADGVPVTLVVRRSHHDAADVVAAVAEEFEADVIVCGTHGQATFAGALARSFSHRLLHVAGCPVVVVPDKQWGGQHTSVEAETVA
ncbi:MAG TPA: universal stress protein [Gaiella sp.]|jgi:nucleotide-binding universal stress UspA family protein